MVSPRPPRLVRVGAHLLVYTTRVARRATLLTNLTNPPMPETPSTVGTATKQRPNPFSPRAMLTVLAIAIVLQFAVNWIWPSTPPAPSAPTVSLTMASAKLVLHNAVEVVIKNGTDVALTLPDPCPSAPLVVERQDGSRWVPLTATASEARCPTLTGPVPAQGQTALKFSTWNEQLFGQVGRYRISLPAGVTTAAVTPVEFDVVERGWFSQAILSSLYQPLYNALVWLITLSGMQLGLAIILLTLLVRLLLFLPTYHSLANQSELQALQPELERIKKLYAADKEKQVSETMKLYKDRNVNPLGSCLPLLVQLPVLWAMYYVLAGGMDPTNHHLLYPVLQHVRIDQITTHFLTLDLLAPHAWQLALIVGALQLLSMKLVTWTLPPEARKGGGAAAGVNNVMTYVLPLMVGYFAYAYQAGLGLYWATSTLFGIGQQLVLKRAKDRRAASKPTAPTAEVQDAEFRELPK